MKNISKNSIILTVVIAIIVGAASFFGGMQYQKMQRGNQFTRQIGQNGGNARFTGPNGQNGARPVMGVIISSDDKSITVKLQDGSSKIVLLSGSTAIMEATSAAKEALQNGKNVMVIGTTNSDGSVTAQNISLNPQLRGGFGGGNRQPGGNQ